MSDPFSYTPSGPTSYAPTPYTPTSYIPTPYTPVSYTPVPYSLPPSPLYYNPGYNPSPFYAQFHPPNVTPHIPAISIPNTPIQGTSNLPIASFSNPPIQSSDGDPWGPRYSRPRRPSIHTPNPFTSSQSLTVPSGYTHTRRRSFSGAYRDTSPWTASPAPSYGLSPHPTPRSTLNPLLQPGSHAVQLDLSDFRFRPTHHNGQPLLEFDLAAPATSPSTERLVIKSDQIPQWPILVDYRTQGSSPLPVSVGEVLEAIHWTMQAQIRQDDWVLLNESRQDKITEAYKKRYKLVPGYEYEVSRRGVKRVDYLLKRVMFAGLEREFGDEGYENLKLVVKNRSQWGSSVW